MIRIAFRYGDRRWFARLVCALRGGDVAHCEVAYEWAGRSHRCVSASWLDHGVRRKVLDLDPAKWRVYEVPGSTMQVANWAAAHEGAHYDWPAFFGFLLLRRLSGMTRWWFCSEVAALQAGLRSPHRFDLFDLESVCQLTGKRVTYDT